METDGLISSPIPDIFLAILILTYTNHSSVWQISKMHNYLVHSVLPGYKGKPKITKKTKFTKEVSVVAKELVFLSYLKWFHAQDPSCT